MQTAASVCGIEQPSLPPHRLLNPHSGPPWKFPCHIGRHYHSTEIPHLQLQRLVSRTAAQIESNFSLVILDFSHSTCTCPLLISRLLISTHIYAIREETGREGKAKSTTQLLPRFICFATTSVQAMEHFGVLFFPFLFIPTKPACFAELAHLSKVQ
jgi:hypothetical protein